jgi:hypothetical protein
MAKIPTRIAIFRMNKTVFAIMGTFVYTCKTAMIRPITMPIIIVYFMNDVIKGTNASKPMTSNDKSANPIKRNRKRNMDLLSETT